MSLCLQAAAALRLGAEMIRARGFAPGHCWIPSVGVNLGARADSGPVCMVSALADSRGPVYRRAYVALLVATRCKSLSTWEGTHTAAEVLDAFARAEELCRVAAGREHAA